MKRLDTYVCGQCSREFGRLWSARRHLNTVEKGIGQVYTSAQYKAMLSTGMIMPPIIPMPRHPFKKRANLYEIALEEYTRGFFRKLGETDLDKTDKEIVDIKKTVSGTFLSHFLNDMRQYVRS